MGRSQLLPALLLGACAFFACPGKNVLQAFAASPRCLAEVGRRGALFSVPLVLPALKPEAASANSVFLFGVYVGSGPMAATAAAAVDALAVGVIGLAGLAVVIAGCEAIDKAILDMFHEAVIPEGFKNQVMIIDEARKDLKSAVGKVRMKLGSLLATMEDEEAFLREPRRIQKAIRELDDIRYEVNNCLTLSKKVEDLGEQYKKDWGKAMEDAENFRNVATVLVMFTGGSLGFVAKSYSELAAGTLFSVTAVSAVGLYQRITEKMRAVKEERDQLQEAALVLQRLEDLKHYAENLKGELEALPKDMDEQAMAEAKKSLQQAVQEVKDRLSHVEEKTSKY